MNQKTNQKKTSHFGAVTCPIFNLIEEDMPADKIQQNKALDILAPIVKKLEVETGIPREPLTAQVILETDWLQKPTQKNNILGIKRAARHSMYTIETTREEGNELEFKRAQKKGVVKSWNRLPSGRYEWFQTAEFAAFKSIEDCLRDYCYLITQPSFVYNSAWKQYKKDKDLGAYVKNISSKYATASNYESTIKSIMAMNNVKEALKV